MLQFKTFHQSIKLYFLQEVDGVKILQLETAAGAAIRVLSPPFSLIYEVHAVHTTNSHVMLYNIVQQSLLDLLVIHLVHTNATLHVNHICAE